MGFNGEYRCNAIKDNSGYYSNTYLGDSPNKECLGDYIECDKFKKAYKKGD